MDRQNRRERERDREREKEKRRSGFIRVKVVFLHTRRRRRRPSQTIVTHVSCPIVPSIAATHEIAHYAHTRAHLYAHVRIIQALAVESKCVWRRRERRSVLPGYVSRARQGRPLNGELYWNNRYAPGGAPERT